MYLPIYTLICICQSVQRDDNKELTLVTADHVANLKKFGGLFLTK
jgi:hypothetical protein